MFSKNGKSEVDVELHLGWSWDCGECGSKNRARSITHSDSNADEAAKRAKDELDGIIVGHRRTMPTVFKCRACGNAYWLDTDMCDTDVTLKMVRLPSVDELANGNQAAKTKAAKSKRKPTTAKSSKAKAAKPKGRKAKPKTRKVKTTRAKPSTRKTSKAKAAKRMTSKRAKKRSA